MRMEANISKSDLFPLEVYLVPFKLKYVDKLFCNLKILPFTLQVE